MKKFILYTLTAGALVAGGAVHALDFMDLPYQIQQDGNGAQYYHDQWGRRHDLNSPYGGAPYGVPYAYGNSRPGWYPPGVAARNDRDGDGVRNRYDRDRDGDGVPNRYDRRPNNPNRR